VALQHDPQDEKDQGWTSRAPTWVAARATAAALGNAASIDPELGPLYLSVANPFATARSALASISSPIHHRAHAHTAGEVVLPATHHDVWD